MTSPELDLDISPIPRSREENQERAFIAASRRKDRSLDARIESANRASQLHKKRTGKALHITKEIVEKEAMYEEVDERYQEKRIRMLQAQNMQIEEEFHRHLLAAFAARANGAAARRASHFTSRPSMEGVGKMSLDLSGIRSSFAEGVQTAPLTSPMVPDQGYVLSPSTSFSHSPQSSYMPTGMETPASICTGLPTPGSQVSSYVPQHTTPTWQVQAQAQAQSQQALHSWQGFSAVRQPEMQSVEMWQQSLQQQSQLPPEAAAIQMRQFRDRLASAPELPARMTATTQPSPLARVSQHTRVHSDPSFLPPQGVNLSSVSSSPGLDLTSTETLSTPELCPTPSTPHSPTSAKDSAVPNLDIFAEKEGDGFMVSSEHLDPDFDEFSRFAFGLDNNSHLQHGVVPWGFDDMLAFEELTPVA